MISDVFQFRFSRLFDTVLAFAIGTGFASDPDPVCLFSPVVEGLFDTVLALAIGKGQCTVSVSTPEIEL